MLPLKWRQTFWCVLVCQICVLSGDNLLVKSVCFWNFIVVAVRYCLGQQDGWCQMGVSEASWVDEVRCLFLRHHRCLWSIRCLFLRWITVDEVRCLCLKLHWFTFDKVRRLFLKLHHCWLWSIKCLFLRWITVDEVRCLFLKFQHWHWYHSVFVTIVWYLGSLMAQGSCFVTMS